MSMSFVPYVPVIPPSARARELGERLAQVIRDFDRQHSDLTEIEIRQALRIALGESGRSEARRAVAAIVAALVVGVGFAVALLARSGGDTTTMMPVIAGALVLFAIVVVLILVRRGG
jgi:hypothetical protein